MLGAGKTMWLDLTNSRSKNNKLIIKQSQYYFFLQEGTAYLAF